MSESPKDAARRDFFVSAGVLLFCFTNFVSLLFVDILAPLLWRLASIGCQGVMLVIGLFCFVIACISGSEWSRLTRKEESDG